MTRPKCDHRSGHRATVGVCYLEDSGRFIAEIRIKCGCGRDFQFIGLPIGLNLNGATMSADGLEARIAVAPVGSVPDPLDGLIGFHVRGPREDLDS